MIIWLLWSGLNYLVLLVVSIFTSQLRIEFKSARSIKWLFFPAPELCNSNSFLFFGLGTWLKALFMWAFKIVELITSVAYHSISITTWNLQLQEYLGANSQIAQAAQAALQSRLSPWESSHLKVESR